RQPKLSSDSRLRPRSVAVFQLYARSFFRHSRIVFSGMACMFRCSRSFYGCGAIGSVAFSDCNRITDCDLCLPDGIVHFPALAPVLPLEETQRIWKRLRHHDKGLVFCSVSGFSSRPRCSDWSYFTRRKTIHEPMTPQYWRTSSAL